MTDETIFVRRAAEHDIAGINRILNDVITNHNYNVSHNTKTMDDTRKWFDQHRDSSRYIILSATCGDRFVGWASLSPFRASEGYNTTAELSVYIDNEYRGKGIGNILMTEIEKYAAQSRQIHCIMSVITADNTPSIELHRKYGYKTEGVFKEIAYKNGQYIDIVMMTKLI